MNKTNGESNLLLGLLAETSIHPGAGAGEGAIDLPVAREAATEYPVIVGSSLKGSLRERGREHWGQPTADAEGDTTPHEQRDPPEVQRLFGKQDEGGQLLIGDARLLLLPVRSLTGRYRWATCPLILERLQRDLTRSGHDPGFDVPAVDPGHALIADADDSDAKPGDTLFLEELQFSVTGALSGGVTAALVQLIPHQAASDRLQRQLVVLDNDDFAHFARFGLQIAARNVLDEKKTSKNLWYEETLPPDTLMVTLIQARRGGALSTFREMLDPPYLRVGGNETVGQGWFAVQPLDGEADRA